MTVAAVRELARLLSDEIDLIEALEPHLAAEEGALRAADASRVLDVIGRATPLTARLAEIESRRRALVERLGAALGGEPRRLTLDRLATLVPEAAPEVRRLRARMQRSLGRVLARSRKNEALVDRAVGFVERLLTALAGPLAMPVTPTYAASGRVRGAATVPRRLVREA
jgi:hypothetical protein